MKITGSKSFSKTKECLVLFCFKKGKEKLNIYSHNTKIVSEFTALRSEYDYIHKENDSVILYNRDGVKKVILFALGENQSDFNGEATRRNASHVVNLFENIEKADIDLTMLGDISKDIGLDADKFVSSLTEGFLLKSYEFKKYMTRKDPEKKPERKIKNIRLVSDAPISGNIKETSIICEGTFLARNLVNEPSNVINSLTFAQTARNISKKYGFKTTVFDKKKIESLGMGGILGVNAGSIMPARLIIAEYKHPGARKTLLLVGKGITFDTGGISLKPSKNMGDMKCDMAGGAAVLSTLMVVSRLKLKVNIIGIVPVTDNKPGGSAQNPGDIIKMHNGMTVEVENTDAEGRLILADALSYGIQKYKPDVTIDIATLTGACIVALGKWAAGLMTNTGHLVPDVTKAGNETYERVWQMPLFSDYEEQLKSDVADVKNTGGLPAGSITAGKFLEKFVDSKPWMHIDIAGTAFLDTASDYLPKGATGFGVRLLTEFIKHWIA